MRYQPIEWAFINGCTDDRHLRNCVWCQHEAKPILILGVMMGVYKGRPNKNVAFCSRIKFSVSDGPSHWDAAPDKALIEKSADLFYRSKVFRCVTGRVDNESIREP